MKQRTQEFIQEIRQYRGYIIGALVALVIVLVFAAVSDAGHRVMGSLGLTDTGRISIVAPRENVKIHINETYIETSDGTETVQRALPVGTHSVIVSRSGLYPWMKTVTVKQNSTITLRPFLVPHNPRTTLIRPSHNSYRALRAKIQSSQPPSPETPITSVDGSIDLWIQNDAIHASWNNGTTSAPAAFCPGGQCRDSITVTPSKAPIRNLAFYRDTHNVAIMAAEEGVYAIELDPRGNTQNFQPIYEGIAPRFAKISTSTIAVYDNGTMRRVHLMPESTTQ